MPNPRYRPRDFVVEPTEFGQLGIVQWVDVDPQEKRTVAHRWAAQYQHSIAFGVRKRYVPKSDTTTVLALAEEMGLPYPRLQRLLTGHVVMQLEDVGRLYTHIGPAIEVWGLSTPHREIIERFYRERQRQSESRRQP
ncbi:hypothetical protein N3K63_03255 [Microbacterium sp. W1N]|uniref:hypothetical protein n=1 Tax=Microbacterium festucae TaxID=2977531 RepID=UPI0021C10458|nr:hypothetical protein [Microbacterium festucae]MCT9819299.1 hypothetical protein [Microbacterium festucae]